MLLPLEHKIYIFLPPHNILYASTKYLYLIQLCSVASTPLRKNMLHYDYYSASGHETFPTTKILSTVLFVVTVLVNCYRIKAKISDIYSADCIAVST